MTAMRSTIECRVLADHRRWRHSVSCRCHKRPLLAKAAGGLAPKATRVLVQCEQTTACGKSLNSHKRAAKLALTGFSAYRGLDGDDFSDATLYTWQA